MQSNEVSTFLEVPPGKLAAVVTSLEMLAPPVRRPAPARDDLVLERVERPPLDWYRRLFRRVGEEWLWFSRLAMCDEALSVILADPLVEVFVLRQGKAEFGLVEFDRRRQPEIELAFFGLAREAIGQGAGRWLMDRALEIAWSYAPRRLWVHTCSFDHPGALAFYRRSGFVPCALAVEIAADPRLSGLLPETAAPHVPLIRP